MSISFLVGIPGSGKTYYAVNEIYENFISDKKKTNEYKLCYTNINELDFSRSNQLKKFDFSVFHNLLGKLYARYKSGDGDNILLEKAGELGISHSYLIIDECHNYFDKECEILVWFFTYHRHLFVDILCITQDLKLVNNKYKMIAEFFYMALPNSKKIRLSKFKYRQFISYRMFQKDKVGDFSLSKKKEIFELYKSGKILKSKSLVHKFLLMSLIMLIVCGIFVKLFFNQFKSKQAAPSTSHTQVKQEKTQDIQNPIAKQDFFSDEIKLSEDDNFYFYDVYCYKEQKCKINNELTIDFNAFKFLTKKIKSVYFFRKDIGDIYHISLIYNFDLFKNLNTKQKDFNDEKNYRDNVFGR